MFVTNYYQSNIIALCCNFDPKHSFCNTLCACKVMQIKLVVVSYRYPLDSAIDFPNIYQLDSDFSGG